MLMAVTLLDRELERIYSTDHSKFDNEQLNTYIKEKLTSLNILSSIQYKLDALSMGTNELKCEKHRSERLGRFMEQEGIKKPAPGFEAHAIVSGKDQRANVLRLQMALRKIRIDDTDNGCWLPKSTAEAVGSPYPKAIPHRRIHNQRYYSWLTNLEMRVSSAMTPLEFKRRLRLVRTKLQHGLVTPLVLK